MLRFEDYQESKAYDMIKVQRKVDLPVSNVLKYNAGRFWLVSGLPDRPKIMYFVKRRKQEEAETRNQNLMEAVLALL